MTRSNARQSGWRWRWGLTREALQLHRRTPGRSALNVFFFWSLVRGFCFLVFRVFYRVKLSGFENVPATGPVIFASNHQTHFDPILVGLVTYDRPFRAIARSTLFTFRPLAWLMLAIGAIPIRQGEGDAGALRAALGELEAGRTVLIFPEGTRTRDGAVQRFKPGIGLLIKRGKVPVVPVTLVGAHEVWPHGQSLPRPWGRIAVHAHPAIPYDELMKDGIEAAMTRLRRVIIGGEGGDHSLS